MVIAPGLRRSAIPSLSLTTDVRVCFFSLSITVSNFCLHTSEMLTLLLCITRRAPMVSGYSHIPEAGVSYRLELVLVANFLDVVGEEIVIQSEGRQRKYPHVFAHSEQVCDIYIRNISSLKYRAERVGDNRA